MGKFDFIHFDSFVISSKEYQTKSLNCLMEVYRVKKDGFLYKQLRADGGWQFTEVDIKMDYTGEIQFYDWHREYIALFVEGRITHVNNLKTGKIKKIKLKI